MAVPVPSAPVGASAAAMDGASPVTVLAALGARGGDELERVLTFLSPEDRAKSRLLNHALLAAASADADTGVVAAAVAAALVILI